MLSYTKCLSLCVVVGGGGGSEWNKSSASTVSEQSIVAYNKRDGWLNGKQVPNGNPMLATFDGSVLVAPYPLCVCVCVCVGECARASVSSSWLILCCLAHISWDRKVHAKLLWMHRIFSRSLTGIIFYLFYCEYRSSCDLAASLHGIAAHFWQIYLFQYF